MKKILYLISCFLLSYVKLLQPFFRSQILSISYPDPVFYKDLYMRKQLFIKIKRQSSSTNLKTGDMWSRNDGPHLSLAPLPVAARPSTAGLMNAGLAVVRCVAVSHQAAEPSAGSLVNTAANRSLGRPSSAPLARPALTTRCKHKIVKILYPKSLAISFFEVFSFLYALCLRRM